VHGLLKTIPKFIAPASCMNGSPAIYFEEDWHNRKAPPEHPGCDMSKLAVRPNINENVFAGVASIRVPYITNTVADWGSICEG
jgi:hypothetical protein